MIPIVEDYLSDLLQQKFKYLKQNPSYLQRVLKTTPDRLARLEQYLASTPINIIKGYPRLPSQLPCVCILLSGEEETQEGLGDFGEDPSDILEITETLKVLEVMDGNLVPLFVLTEKRPLEGIVSIHHEGRELIPEQEYYLIDPHQGLIELSSDSGILPEDDVQVRYYYEESLSETTQVLYEANYRLESWSTNGDLTVELYHLTKWVLLSSRNVLGKDFDIFRQRLGGSDFEPATSYFPEFVYRRAMTFWCQFTASSPVGDFFLDGNPNTGYSTIDEVIVTDKAYSNNGGD